MRIKPFDIIQIKDKSFFFVNHIVEKRNKGSITKKLFAFGVKIEYLTKEELQKIEIKKIINKYEAVNLISLNIEEEIIAVISNKTKKEWRLNKKVPIL
jgi:lipid II:glycine glycyltransferase (peptidoglycan interpeptide bridge formation enzyme)